MAKVVSESYEMNGDEPIEQTMEQLPKSSLGSAPDPQRYKVFSCVYLKLAPCSIGVTILLLAIDLFLTIGFQYNGTPKLIAVGIMGAILMHIFVVVIPSIIHVISWLESDMFCIAVCCRRLYGMKDNDTDNLNHVGIIHTNLQAFICINIMMISLSHVIGQPIMWLVYGEFVFNIVPVGIGAFVIGAALLCTSAALVAVHVVVTFGIAIYAFMCK